MKKPYINNVCLASAGATEKGYRQGTAFLTLQEFAKKFGDPHQSNFNEDGIDGSGKVHAIWIIKTPRGNAAVRDYWWNPETELSICAPNRMAYLWTKGWLKCYDVKCKNGTCGN